MAESLRDQLSKAYDEVAAETPTETPAPQATSETVAAETPEPDKPGRTAGRARDEKGRLLPGPAVRQESAAEPKTPPAQESNAQAPIEAPAAEQKQHPNRPSSWKKEYWDHWTKLDPSVAEYILQRENDYAKGVSTYKKEWESAKPLLEAMAPFQREFPGIDPAQQIARYMQIHKDFAQGSPQVKLQRFMELAQSYQVPIENLFVQGQDGRIYFNQQLMQQAQQAAQQPSQQPDVRKLVQEALTEQTMQQQIEAMKSDTQKYPHFEVLRETMAGLLQSGLAQDLPSAYDKALRMDENLYAQEQDAKRKADEATKAESARKAAEAARRNAVSPKTQTPAGTPAQGKKGLRSTLESAYDEHVGSRV